ncbi:acyltransferase [Pseudomonas sp. NFIX28]|uniref:acyltransferase family protein n=1 Tax=Pseudomonas sp. NFIX28 TaxID=1566235 RepID=UPI000896A741|nr:acyltransferase [Pseudomonas sp. NFIX28]SDY58952.1 Peptidoglycan/LPS O-acetylase OafA/YrhL, contains acyltransferase and SGNH-hydrolase domains [Pseudomonas sp. NFIX28]
MNDKRIMDIELLRGLAVLGVVFHHLQGSLFRDGVGWLGDIAAYGQFWWGVDLFFAISGFVIARSLIPQLRACTSTAQFWQRTRDFWIRRAFRLLPSAWLWLLLMLLASLFLNRSGAFGSLHANLWATLAGLLQFANLRFADSFFHYEYGASFVYWSLSLEEQFYLLLPVLVLLCRKYLAWVLLALVLVQLLTTRSALLMVIRTDAMALGVLLALWTARGSYRHWEPKWLGRYPGLGPLLLILSCLGLGWLATDGFNVTRYRVGALAVLCALLVWIASYNRDYLLPRGRLKSLLAWVGSRSYGIYLIHVPVFLLVREAWFRLAPHGADGLNDQPLLALACAVGLLLLLSELNYRVIELPLRNRGAELVQRLGTSRSPVPSTGVTSC